MLGHIKDFFKFVLGAAALLGGGGVLLLNVYAPHLLPQRLLLGNGMTQTAAPQPAPRPVVYSAGRPMPMPDEQLEQKTKRTSNTPGRQASAMRATDGHFYFDTFVNGTSIRTMFDTGAGFVALTYDDAARIGIDVSNLNFDIRTSTANGTGRAASVVLASVRVGDITKNNVRAAVLPRGSLGVTLLGQSFSSRVTSYRYERSELILTDN